VKPGQKFCTKCGEKLIDTAAPQQTQQATQAATPAQADNAHARQQGAPDVVQTSSQHIYWTIQQGQIARVITPQELAAYRDAKGVIVSEGTTAYVRVDGKTVCTFRAPKPTDKIDFKGAFEDLALALHADAMQTASIVSKHRTLVNGARRFLLKNA
jgi:hypothetical protein